MKICHMENLSIGINLYKKSLITCLCTLNTVNCPAGAPGNRFPPIYQSPKTIIKLVICQYENLGV